MNKPFHTSCRDHKSDPSTCDNNLARSGRLEPGRQDRSSFADRWKKAWHGMYLSEDLRLAMISQSPTASKNLNSSIPERYPWLWYLHSMRMFQSSAEIRKCALELVAYLQDLQDVHGRSWTEENFRRLETFAQSMNPDLKSYYRKQGEKSEFLWDFISSGLEAGIFLAAESEQAVHTERDIVALKHDFEKLLYVYSPIRVLITKAKDRQ